LFVRSFFHRVFILLFILMETIELPPHRDPSSFTLNDDELQQIEHHVETMRPELNNIDINLETDSIKLPKQNYALISIVAPHATNQKSDKLCVKIKGVFDTLEQAQAHAQRLMNMDATFDIIVTSMYEWLLLPPPLDHIHDQVYMDNELNTLISEYRTTQERSKLEFDIRKQELKKNKPIITEQNDLDGIRETDDDDVVEADEGDGIRETKDDDVVEADEGVEEQKEN